jgi:hypothetical protein
MRYHLRAQYDDTGKPAGAHDAAQPRRRCRTLRYANFTSHYRAALRAARPTSFLDCRWALAKKLHFDAQRARNANASGNAARFEQPELSLFFTHAAIRIKFQNE